MSKWRKGESGNPTGRPKGKETHSTCLRRILQDRSEELINKTVELALAGDGVALRLCIERLIPRAKENTASVILPDFKSLHIDKVGTEILNMLSGQEISLSELKNLLWIVNYSLENDKPIKHPMTPQQIEAFDELLRKHQREY